MNCLIKVIFAYVYPAFSVFKKEIGLRYFCQKYIKIIIINLYPPYGIKVIFSIGRALGEKSPVAETGESVSDITCGNTFLNTKVFYGPFINY